MYTQDCMLEWRKAETLYNNYYHCPHCGAEWHFLSDSVTSDTCPNCGVYDVDPLQSDAV